MFEITGKDIAALNDTDLRSLIGLLCEADLRRCNLSTSAVTWGGNQTAKDGGLDVRVALPSGTPIDGFIKRPATGFQVKTPDMQRAKIIAEMCPGGVVRPVIAELARESGAYIIVSSKSTTADVALANRRAAMADAISGIPDAEKLTLDFYDSNRVATWVRDHAGLIAWIREKIGRAMPGWRGYGAWASVPDGADAAYLVDDTARLKTGDKDEGDGLPVVDGINKIRETLGKPGHVVRLVGLSGVGKTRLVEALFDATLGVNSLDPSLAFYTDITSDPNPPPAILASDLIAARTRAILVIDNCQPGVHRQLSEIARASGSTISVITVEYDIREDQPEGTDVFTLETSSIPLIEKLVANRFRFLSSVDVHTIAEFSGGNARIALALAGTVGKTETIAGLNSAELFERLFYQRHGHDASLLMIGQACSLVYSFQGEALSGDDTELPILAELIGRSAGDLFTGIAELKRRDLLQSRSVWRAVLPHAIANRLAELALQNIPSTAIESAFMPSPRLLQSFSRRLGYLDGSKEASTIVQRWLAPGGLLADITSFDELKLAIFANVAPVDPEAALWALERTYAQADVGALRSGKRFLRLLRSLAYEPAHYARAIAVLTRFIDVEGEHESKDAAGNAIVSLFTIVLSGTRAPVEARLQVASDMIRSSEPAVRKIGVEALGAMMKSDGFTSSYSFDFGARSRGHGYFPPTGKDVGDWFEATLTAAETLVRAGGPEAGAIRKEVAHEFRGLWTNGGRYDALERFARMAAGNGFWRDGWVAARETRRYDAKRLEPESDARLAALQEFLAPKDLANTVRGKVFNDKGGGYDVHGDDLEDAEKYQTATARAKAAVEKLGGDVAADSEALRALLPELVSGRGNLRDFGYGLARDGDNPRGLWDALVEAFGATAERNDQVLCGFLLGCQERDAAMADAMLDQSLVDDRLAEWFPELQASVVIDDTGIARLHRALSSGRAPILRFYDLAYARPPDMIPGPAFRDLAVAIAEKPGGMRVAIEMLSMRLNADHFAKRAPQPETLETGRMLLERFAFAPRAPQANRQDYELGIIAKACLKGDGGAAIAAGLWPKLRTAIAQYTASASDYDDFMEGLFHVQPTAMLDAVFAGAKAEQKKSVSILHDMMRSRKNPLSTVPDDVILAWCDRDAQTRYVFAAATVWLFQRSGPNLPHVWNSIAAKLLRHAPNPVLVLNEIIARLRPTSFSGSFATKLESRLQLFKQLDLSTYAVLNAAFDAACATLQKKVDEERRSEAAQSQARSGRFE
jgi:beta-phosphoglucomutase-like phosphatase (HAD superfamily)